uniref:Uncharacterized protein n=1 Tax=Oryza glumipatula TaxID=40148 RepID=A0A0E0B8D6_9ORYZ
MAIHLRILIFPRRRHRVPPEKIHLYRRSFKRVNERYRTNKEDLSKIERRTSFHCEDIKNIQRDLYHFIYHECCHKDGFFFDPEGSLAINSEYKSIWKWNYMLIINLGLSPKISNVDDVALTMMWPSTLMRTLYLSPSTKLCLQTDSHHARERGGEEGTRRTTKEEWWRQQPGGGGSGSDSALPLPDVAGGEAAAAAVIAPSPLPDVARGEAVDLGSYWTTAGRDGSGIGRQRRGTATSTVPPPLCPTTFLSPEGRRQTSAAAGSGVGRPPALSLLVSIPPPSYRRSGSQIRHAPSPPALGGGQLRGWWSRRLGAGDVDCGGGRTRPEASTKVQWAASTAVFLVGF